MPDTIFRFPSHKGLFSGLNSLCSAAHIVSSQGDGSRLFIDAHDSPYFIKVGGIERCFKVRSVKDMDEETRKKCEWLDVAKLNELGKINSFHILTGEQVNAYIPYQDDFKLKIDNRIKQLDLPEDYICIQVRRGDKVNEKPSWTSDWGRGEADRFEFETYVEKWLEAVNLEVVPDDWNLFIMTDDYKVIGEFENFKQKYPTHPRMWTLCQEHFDGYSVLQITKDKYQYSEQEMIDLFAEMEIAKKANWFIGTQSSHVWRYIRRTAVDPRKCLTLDKNARTPGVSPN